MTRGSVHWLLRLMGEKDQRDLQRFEAQEKALADALRAVEQTTQAAFKAAEQATTKAETAAERRFESVNEFRAQLTDQASTFMPRAEARAQFENLATRMEAAAAGIYARIDRADHEIDSLASKMDRGEGRSGGLNAGWGYLVAAAGVAVAIASRWP